MKQVYEEYTDPEDFGESLVDNFYKHEHDETMQYKFSKGFKKGVVGFIVFALPLALANLPDVANLTLGAVGMIIVNYLKVKYANL